MQDPIDNIVNTLIKTTERQDPITEIVNKIIEAAENRGFDTSTQEQANLFRKDLEEIIIEAVINS